MDIVYTLDSKIPFDVTLQVTMGGGVINTGKNLNVMPGDRVVLQYGGEVLGSALILDVVQRTKTTQEIAHGRVEALTPAERALVGSGVHARGGAYLR